MIVLFSSCVPEDFITEGLSPVYFSYDDFSGIKSGEPMPYDNLGKIVSLGDYIYINEINKGIHVIDNSDPLHPKPLFFWHIAGNKEFTLKDEVLYADNGRHLLIIDISNPSTISLINVIREQYDFVEAEEYPRDYIGWFQCYEVEKGILLGWEQKQLINPVCTTND